VQRVKFELSRSHSAEFRFHDGSMDLRISVTRRDFESWIENDLQAIENSVDGLLQTSGIDPRAVDRVFLTGGSSFVPAVRSVFETRFGNDRIRSGNELPRLPTALPCARRSPRVKFRSSLPFHRTREYVADMTDRKRKVATSDNDHQALVRARRFLEDHGIDSAAIIHREDAAHFLVEFASFERESRVILFRRRELRSWPKNRGPSSLEGPR